MAAKERYRSKVNYTNKKNEGAKAKYDDLSEEFHEMQQLFYSKVKDLNEVIGNKENECDNLLLENEELMQAKSEKAIVPTFFWKVYRFSTSMLH